MKSLSSRHRFLLLFIPLVTCVMTSSAIYVAETYIYVEPNAVQLWERVTGKGIKSDIETEIQSMMAEVNEIYKGIDEFKIKFVVKEIEFLSQAFTGPSQDNYVQAETGLALFEYWLKANEKNHDLALLLTGSTLTFAASIYPLGLANIGEICGGPRSAAMIRLVPSYKGALVIAHEIGHVLGARHDGDGNQCNPKDEYLMIYSTMLTENRYKFSECSRRSMKNTLINLYQSNCLKDHMDDVQPEVPRFGSLLTADAVCKRRYGSTAYVDRKVYSGSYGDNVCLTLACNWKNAKTGELKTAYQPSPDGLYCGKNKQCIKGRCVTTAHGLSTVSDSCPFGDQPVIEGSYPKSCGQIDSSQCHLWKDICCQTCNEDNPEFSKTGDDACRQLEGEKSYMLRSYNASTYEDKMCGELRCLKETPLVNRKFQWNKYKAPNGMACGKNKRCQDGSCVVSSEGNPDIKDDCPFGDLPWVGGVYKMSCDAAVWRGGCKGWGKLCCQSCQEKTTIGR